MKRMISLLMVVCLTIALAQPVGAQTTNHQETLNITVTTPGTMGDLVLAQTENFSDVKHFTVSGPLNDDDLATICNRMTSLVTLNMSEAITETMPQYGLQKRDALKTVVLPKTLTEVSYGLFSECKNLTSVTMHEGIKTIGDVAFRSCESITWIDLPETVEEFGTGAFENDTSLFHIGIPAHMTNWRGSVFAYCKNLTGCRVPEGIEELGSSTFSGCKALTFVQLPSTLKSIKDYAFGGCDKITSITLPEGLQDLHNTVFAYCHGLTHIDLPTTTRTIYSNAFYPCNNLRTVRCHAINPPQFDSSSRMGGYGYDENGQYQEINATVYVPSPSLNAYKQRVGWDKHSIKPLTQLPSKLIFYTDMELNLPDFLPADYNPIMRLEQSYIFGSKDGYPAITINGTSTLSLSDYHAYYDLRYYTGNDSYSGLNSNKIFGCIISNAPIRADRVSLTFFTNYYTNSYTYWNFISLPFNARISEMELAKGSDFVIYKYNGAKRAATEFDDTWQRVPNNATLLAGRGYIMKCSNQHEEITFHAIDDNYKNDIFRQTEAVVQLEEHLAEDKHNRSWNLIGNPYPAYYDTRLMQHDGPFIVWNRFYRQYETYRPTDDDYVLEPSQAFFVQRSLKQATITFPLEGRQNSLAVVERATTDSRRMAAAQRTLFNLHLSDGEGLADRTRFVLNPQATTDYDDGCDATKFMSLDTQVPQLYTLEGGERYSINERPLSDGIVRLGMTLAAAGTYTLSLAAPKGGTYAQEPIVLIDHETGTRTLITDGAYTFTASSGTYDSRFTLELGAVVTNVQHVAVAQQQTEPVFDLQGRRLAPAMLHKGLYIIGGKKHVVK
ncbi:MAG: leucine-rich repeat domain-containing protein [Prevotella sp.]|nr:leucine-rich repeat domain-containing protein [Prevotella sp.]